MTNPDLRGHLSALIDRRDELVTDLASVLQRVLKTRESAYSALFDQLDAHQGRDDLLDDANARNKLTDDEGERLAATLETDIAALVDVRVRALAVLEAS